jgi:hypothetical protein
VTETVVHAGLESGSGEANSASPVSNQPSFGIESVFVNPSAAVFAAYQKVEMAIRARLDEAKFPGAQTLAGKRLVDVALQEHLISPEIADAVFSLLDLRNESALGHNRAIDVTTAFAYMSLCDSMLSSIRAWRRRPTDSVKKHGQD